MDITVKHIAGVSLVIILLVGANVYQFQNPKTVKVPEKQTEIDEGAWVKQSAYAGRGMIIDSLEAQNKKLAQRVKESRDKIASYVSITGRLRTEIDSLEQQARWNAFSIGDMMAQIDSLAEDSTGRDTTDVVRRSFTETRSFGGGLFKVTGRVEININPCGFTAEQIQLGLHCPSGWLFRVRQDLQLDQLRDIRLDVASTVNEDRSRALVYVTSPDFEDLEYQSYTEFEPETKLPKFWIGLATGAGAALTAIIVLN